MGEEVPTARSGNNYAEINQEHGYTEDEENIAEVFGVTCDIVHAKGENPMRIIIKDEILTGEDDNE